MREVFACGVPELDAYLKTRARREMDLRVAVVYVLCDEAEGRIAGYYTVSALSVELPEDMRRGLARYPEYPATLIGRLAVDERYGGRGLGERLLLDALGRALAGSRAVASYAVVTDAKSERAEAFYARYGFMPLPGASGGASGGQRMFLPMRTVERLFEEV